VSIGNTLDDLDKLYDPSERLLRREGGGRLRLKFSLEYVLRLFERDAAGDRERACGVVRRVIELQSVEPEWRFGQLPMHSDGEYVDRNSNCFQMPALIGIASRHLDKMPSDLAGAFAKTVERAVVFLERRWDNELFVPHRDGLYYSNIFLLYTQGLLLAARHYDSERLWLKGAAQWRRWFNHVAYYGIDEFASPTYNSVCYRALAGIRELARAARMREEARLALDHLCALQYAISHPALKMPVCGISRSYRKFLPPDPQGTKFVEGPDPAGYSQPVSARREYANRSFPHRAVGRATFAPYRFQTWQVEDAAIGSMTGGHYFPQNLFCMAAVGRSESEREVFFAPGCFTFRSGFTAQAGPRAVCLFTRRPQYYNRTQCVEPDSWLDGLEEGLPASLGLSDGWDIAESEDRIALRAYGRALHVFPFVADGGAVKPAAMSREMLPVHHIERACYVFPKAPEWFGCAVVLANADEDVPPPRMRFERTERNATLTCDRITVRLFLQPAGEATQLYEDDWRTAPLFQCPTGTLWPGRMAEQIANAGFPSEPPAWMTRGVVRGP